MCGEVECLIAADSVVAGIGSGASKDDVLRRFGPPREYIPDPTLEWPKGFGYCDTDVPHTEELIYTGLRFVLSARTGKLQSIILTDATYPTRRGLRVGQTAREALALYGRPHLLAGTLLHFSGLSAGVYLELSKEGVIKSIQLS